MQTQYVISYRIDLYFHDQKLEIEIDENGNIIDYKIKKQKVIEQELGCKFIITDPTKEEQYQNYQ